MLAFALAFSSGIACCAHRNCPVRFTASVRSQSRNATSSQWRGGTRDAGIVHERVEAAERGRHGVEEARDGRGIRHVADALGQCGIACGQCAERRSIDVADVHARAFAGEGACGRQPDARGARRHQYAQIAESRGPWHLHNPVWKTMRAAPSARFPGTGPAARPEMVHRRTPRGERALWVGLQPDASSSKAEALPTSQWALEFLWVGLQPDMASREAPSVGAGQARHVPL